MADQDAIDQFIAMPKEERGKLFEQLAPAKQQSLLAEIKKRKGSNPPSSTDPSGRTPTGEPAPQEGDWRDPYTQIHPHERPKQSDTVNSVAAAKYLGREGVKGIGNIGAGALGVILHPVNTVAGTLETIGGTITAPFEMMGGRKFGDTVPGQMVESLRTQPLETVEQGIGQAGAMAGVGDVIGPVAAKLKGMVANAKDAAVRGATGTGPKVVADYVVKTARDNERAIKEAGEKTAVKQERVDEINKRRAEADAEKAKKVAEQNKAAEERFKGIKERRSAAHKARIEKAKSANDAALKAHDDEVAAADKKMRDAHIKYLAEKSEIERANQEAGAVPRANEETSALVKDRTEEMDVRVENARHDALREGNEKYNTVNEQLNPLREKPGTLQTALLNASEKIKGSDTSVPILNDMERFVKENEPATYEKLQGYYSELGRELVKGTLPGDVYQALDTLHESIGNEMQRIADSQGLGTELKSAREYWRRMKQTFGKSTDTINNRAGEEVNTTNPDYIKQQKREYRLRLLGSFDPAIPKLAAEIDEATGKLKAKASETVKPVPSAPESIVVNPPATKPVPEPRQPIQAPQPKPVPEPRQPLSVKPVQADVKVVTPETLTQVKADAAIDKALSVQHSPGHIATVFLALDAIRRVFNGDVVGLGKDVAARGVYALGKNAYAKILMNPKVINAVSNLTAEDVAQAMRLPESQRSGFVEVVRQANEQGIKVDPKVLALIGASAATPRGPKSQELQKTADEYRQNSTQQ